MGGVNYLVNLAKILRSHAPDIEPVIFSPPGTGAELANDVLAATGRAFVPLRNRTKRDDLFDLLGGSERPAVEAFRRERIDLVFESATYYGSNIGLPILSWIPDFQHRHLPHFFPRSRWWARDVGYRLVLANRTDVMLSSQSALNDANQFYSRIRARLHVVPFAVRVAAAGDGDPAQMRKKYDLPERYFFLPNQLWVHKNHSVVIEALGLLRSAGAPLPTVVATGTGFDSRAPDLLERLQLRIDNLGVGGNFRFLGQIPYPDLRQLLEGAEALINPSLFEGWSTTVEEARALGSPMILSDLPVHREQVGQAADYFDPRSAADCVRALGAAAAREARRRTPPDAAANERRQQIYAERFREAAKSAVERYRGRRDA
jgi:glycosyltransferase involved in cell wall biosynthesis